MALEHETLHNPISTLYRMSPTLGAKLSYDMNTSVS